MDYSTITEEEVVDPAELILQEDVNDIVMWSEDNNTSINGKKDKGDDYILQKEATSIHPLKVPSKK